MTLEAIFSEALALTNDEREILAKRLLGTIPANTPPPIATCDPPKGIPIYGRGKGKMKLDMDDNSHLADFAEYMQ